MSANKLIILFLIIACSCDYEENPVAWVSLEDFPGNQEYFSSALYHDKAYIFFGTENNSSPFTTYSNYIWTYDLTNDTWEVKNIYEGLSRRNASAFTLGDFIYIIGGEGYRQNEGTVALNEFLKYDPVLDSWSSLDPFPGPARYSATSFTNNGIAYYGLGIAKGIGSLNDFWSYNPATNEWVQLPDFPGSLPDGGYNTYYATYSMMVNFIYQDKLYLLAGVDYDHPEMWYFDIETSQWNQITEFQFEDEQSETFFMPRNRTISLTHQGFGYVILGVRLNSPIGNPSVYRYDFEHSSWKKVGTYPDEHREGAFGYSFNNSIIFGTGYDPYFKKYESWKFIPPPEN